MKPRTIADILGVVLALAIPAGALLGAAGPEQTALGLAVAPFGWPRLVILHALATLPVSRLLGGALGRRAEGSVAAVAWAGLGLLLAKLYGWLWMDPLAGIIGAVVIANWSVTLIRDTAGVLLDVCPDELTREKLRRTFRIIPARMHDWRG